MSGYASRINNIKDFFPHRKSLILIVSAWMFVDCYILIVRLTGLQEFHFVPSYAACMNVHLRKFGKIVHYFLAVGLFFTVPTDCYHIQLQKGFKTHRGTQ